MQQDFLSKNKELLSSLMEASDRLPLPIALVDQELLQCWENQYLKKHYPFLCSKDNVLSLLQGYDVHSLILSLQSQDAILSCPSRVPMVNTSLTLSPSMTASRCWSALPSTSRSIPPRCFLQTPTALSRCCRTSAPRCATRSV